MPPLWRQGVQQVALWPLVKLNWSRQVRRNDATIWRRSEVACPCFGREMKQQEAKQQVVHGLRALLLDPVASSRNEIHGAAGATERLQPSPNLHAPVGSSAGKTSAAPDPHSYLCPHLTKHAPAIPPPDQRQPTDPDCSVWTSTPLSTQACRWGWHTAGVSSSGQVAMARGSAGVHPRFKP